MPDTLKRYTNMTNAANDTFDILVNGQPRQINNGDTIASLLRNLSLEGRKVAVAINRSVIPRGQFEISTLEPGDRVEILEAVGGG
ncbi:sulfur carrier protein ThiS [Myxococcota bacterium]|nr:sulfur carrier protein ThiS [Myxococcota bacterium]